MPVLNADQFLTRFREIRGQYPRTVQPLLQQMRARLVGEPTAEVTQAKVDLEAHVRVYVVNSFLADVPPILSSVARLNHRYQRLRWVDCVPTSHGSQRHLRDQHRANGAAKSAAPRLVRRFS